MAFLPDRLTVLPCARTAASAQEPTASCELQFRGAFSATKDAGAAPSESIVTMPVSVGHRQPAFTAVVGEATRREQILTDEDESAGRDHRDPNGANDSPLRWVRGLDGSEGHAHKVDRGIAFFRAEYRGSEPHPVVDGKANPLGQSLLDRCHLRARVEEPRYRQGPRGLEATGLQGLLVFGTYPDPDVDEGARPCRGVSPGVASAQGTTLGR